jgi:hypothetical protein
MTPNEYKTKLFYTPPKDEYFEELKSLCILFWKVFPEYTLWDEKQYELEQEYAESKIHQIKDLKNEGTNFIMMVQMIHQNSREVLSKHLSLEISMRLYEIDNEFDPFNIWNIKNNIHE